MPGFPEALLMSCITGNYYSDRIKACVDPTLWEDPCEIGGITTQTTPTVTATQTTPTTRPTETSTPWSKPSLPPLQNCNEPTCEGSEIFILWPNIDPTKFYQCAPDNERGWAPKIHTCPSPLLFSYEEQVCVWPYQWENPCNVAPPSTTPRPGTCLEPVCNPLAPERTFYPNPEPTKYWQCIPGYPEALLMACITGKLYSDRIKACVDPAIWEDPCQIGGSTGTARPTETSTAWSKPPLPPLENCDEPSCQGSGIFILWPNIDPTKFYQCAPDDERGWAPKVHTCPSPLLFSYEEQVCVWPYQWENPCGVSPPSTTPGPGTCLEPTCNPLAPERTFYPNPEPTKYWQCIPGYPEALLMSCIAGNYYSDRIKACVDPSLWENPCKIDTTSKAPTTTTQAPTTTITTQSPTTITTQAPTTSTTTPRTTESVSTIGSTILPPITCEKPECDGKEDTRYPDWNPNHYWQCAPGFEAPYYMDCPPETLFSYRFQVCVYCEEWENPCNITSPIPTRTTQAQTSTTQTPTTRATTTQTPTTTITTTTQAPSTTITTQASSSTTTPRTTEGVNSTTQTPTTTTTTTTQAPSSTITTQASSSTTTSRTTEGVSTIGSTVTPPFGKCDEPDCSDCVDENLYPAWDPTHYWQCAQGYEKAFYKKCPDELLFSDIYKVCVYCDQWENPCNVQNVVSNLFPIVSTMNKRTLINNFFFVFF